MHRHLRARPAAGHCMEPVIREGDVIVYDLAPARVVPGDVVVIGDVVHRIVWIDPAGGVWNCGDSPSAVASRRPKNELRGKALATVRDGQWIDLESAERAPTDVARLVAAGLFSHALWRGKRLAGRAIHLYSQLRRRRQSDR